MSATGEMTRRGGFTLLEMLVVILLVVLVATALPIAFQRLLPARQLHATAQQVAMELRALQSRAALTGKARSAQLDETQRALRLDGEAHVIRLPAKVTAEFQGRSSHLTDAAVIFYPDGSSSGGVIHLANASRSLDVVVSPVTGRIRVRTP